MSTPILKSLKAEPGDEPDMNAYEPVGLNEDARAVWDHFARKTPYWWAVSDLLTVERYCDLVGVVRAVRRKMDEALNRTDDDATHDYKTFYAILKSASLELKNLEYQLGLTPQGRAALKLPHGANQGEKEGDDEDGYGAINPDDL